MISANNISVNIGGDYLLKDVSFAVGPGDKIGLIGRNGSGKTTLLRLIAGLSEPDEGAITAPKDFSIGYLPQTASLSFDNSLFEEVASSLTNIRSIEKKISDITEEISNRDDYESKEYRDLTQKLSEANEKLDILGGGSIEAEIERVLLGLGFDRDEFGKPLAEFSGGWQMRAELAKILLNSPDCILLDEPTNHLDIESILWIEEYLKNYRGATILVSHDRKFLDSVTNRTIEILKGKIFDFDLPYTKFVEQVKEIKEQKRKEYDNKKKQIAETERFIERFRAKARLASRVQSRVKALEKIEMPDLVEEDASTIDFEFPVAPRSGKTVVETKNLRKSYGDNLVLDGVDFHLGRGEKVAFIGKNGEGKSTLSRIIAGMEDCEGELKIGSNVKLGFYAQREAEALDGEATVFDTIDSVAVGEMRKRMRDLLGAFLFSGDSIYKKVKVLSGGEKSRLVLAKLLLNEVNFLILDEPTNHLDMVSKDILKNALKSYGGALVVVSHDREFLKGITKTTYRFRDKNIEEYPGDIDYFLEKNEMRRLQDLEKIDGTLKATKSKSGKKGDAKIEREKRKKEQRDKNKLKNQIQRLEDEIEKLEEKSEKLEKLFAKPDFFENKEKSIAKQTEFEEINSALEQKINYWTELQAKYEEM